MKILHIYNDCQYMLSNDDLKLGDKVYPISYGKVVNNIYIHKGFDYSVVLSGFPHEPHTVIEINYSDDIGYKLRTNKGFGVPEQYFKVIANISVTEIKDEKSKAIITSIQHWTNDHKQLILFGGLKTFSEVFSSKSCALCKLYRSEKKSFQYRDPYVNTCKSECPLVMANNTGCDARSSLWRTAYEACDANYKTGFLEAVDGIISRLELKLTEISGINDGIFERTATVVHSETEIKSVDKAKTFTVAELKELLSMFTDDTIIYYDESCTPIKDIGRHVTLNAAYLISG